MTYFNFRQVQEAYYISDALAVNEVCWYFNCTL